MTGAKKRPITSARFLKISNLDLSFQPKENLIEENVIDCVSRIRRGEVFPPLLVRFDGTTYYLWEGFHRVEAAKRCGLTRLRAEVLPGTLQEMEEEYRHGYLPELKKLLRSPVR
jgi:ParB-like chromosome segregation protein Spo0J